MDENDWVRRQGDGKTSKRGEQIGWGQAGGASPAPTIHVMVGYCMAMNRRSEVMGRCVIRTPTASKMAFATAAPTGTTGGSPTPLAPKGPRAEGTSTRMDVICGISTVCGNA